MADARRRTFGPVVLLGLASAGLAAVAGNRAWIEWTGESKGQNSLLTISGDDSADGSRWPVPWPSCVLACWGVLLVTRGRVRRVIAGVGVVTSIGMVVTAILGCTAQPPTVSATTSPSSAPTILTTASTGWYWIYLARAVLAVVTTLAAVRLVPGVAGDGQPLRRPADRPHRPPRGRPAWTCGGPSTRGATRPCRTTGPVTPRLSPSTMTAEHPQEHAWLPPRQHAGRLDRSLGRDARVRRRRYRPDARPDQHADLLGRLSRSASPRSSSSP